MKRTDLETMTIEELQQAKLAIDAQIAALRDEKRAIAAAEDRKLTEQTMRAKLSHFSDGERAALAQLVKANGVPSGETFGAPGA